MGMRKPTLLACAAASAVVAQATPCRAAEEPAVPALDRAQPPSHRFAFTPSWAHAFVPRSVSVEAIGLTLQGLFGRTRRFGVGLAGALYSPFSRTLAAVPSNRADG